MNTPEDELFQTPRNNNIGEGSPPSPLKLPQPKPWISITVGGATAGVIVAALTFTATSTAANAVATSTGFAIDIIGSAVSVGTTYFMGSVAGCSVKLASKVASKTTEQALTHSGLITAGIMSTVACAATALTVTAGTRLIQYSIEYGGKISHEVAIQISEAYLKYKATNSKFNETGDLEELVDDDWMLIHEPIPTEIGEIQMDL